MASTPGPADAAVEALVADRKALKEAEKAAKAAGRGATWYEARPNVPALHRILRRRPRRALMPVRMRPGSR